MKVLGFVALAWWPGTDEIPSFELFCKRRYIMTMTDLTQEPASKADLKDLEQRLHQDSLNLKSELTGIKWIVPVIAATNGLLVLVGISVVGTLIFKLFEN